MALRTRAAEATGNPRIKVAIVGRVAGRASRAARRLVCLTLLPCLVAAGGAVAEAQEFWPEIDVWLRVSPEWRLSLFVPLTKNIETKYREGALILQADYAWGKPHRGRRLRLLDENRAQHVRAMLLRGGYLTARSLGDDGEGYTERMAFGELHVRTPLKGSVLVSNRMRTDLRWIGGTPEFSTRWRYRLMVEKEFVVGGTSVVPYGSVEPSYDSRFETVNRVRLIGGATVALSSRFALEGNWTYQHDTRSSVTDVHALNVVLHVFFETARAP